MPTASLPTLIDQFADALAARGKHQQTVANYRFYLNRFAMVTGAREVSQITPETIGIFQTWLKERRLKSSTRNYHGTALRTFLKWLNQERLTHLSPRTVVLLPTPPRTVRTLTTPGLNRLLHFPLKIAGREVILHRDRALLELLGSSGLRVGEISRLRRENLILERGEIAVAGRGGRLRVVPLTQQARYWITQYLKRRPDTTPQLFIRHDPASQRRKALVQATAPRRIPGLTPRSIQRMIKKYARAAGLDGPVQPRTLRHTVASRLLAAGHDVETVRQRLGHQSLNTTKIYLHPQRPRSR